MPRLIAAFIRHGHYKQLTDVPSALQPFALTKQGQQQAKQAARSILSSCQQHQWAIHSVIDCSNLLRAWQTAQHIKSVLQTETSQTLSLTSHEALCERSVGSVANLTMRQIEDILKEDPRHENPPANWKSDSYYCLPFQGAESLMNSGQRVAQHIRHRMQTVKTQISEDTLLLFVGHGASFRHAAYQFGILKFEQIAQLSMYHAQPIFLELLGVHEYQHIAGEWKIRNKQETHTD